MLLGMKSVKLKGTNIVSSVDPFGDGSLVAKYEFENNVLDTTGTYNGTATSLTYGPGVFGQAGVFNGTTSTVLLSRHSLGTTSDLTISAHIKNYQSAGRTNMIVGSDTATATNFAAVQFFIDTDNKVVMRYWHTDRWRTTSVSANALVDGEDYLVCGTISAGASAVFIDAVQEATHQGNRTLLTPGNDVYMGYGAKTLDQVEIYNKKLTTLEMSYLKTQKIPN